MTFTAFLLIGGSVLLHALWNFLCKSRSPHFDFFLVYSLSILVTAALFAAGFCAAGAGFNVAAVSFRTYCLAACAGICGGVFTDVGLSFAYRHCDISMAYPMARALPVLMTAVLTGICGFGQELSPGAFCGMGVIFLGCLLMPLPGWSHLRLSAYCNRGMFGILLAALGTTGYTILDGFGMQELRACTGDAGRIASSAAYQSFREACAISGLLIATLLIPRERVHLTADMWKHPSRYFAGFFAALAYLLILLAMVHVTNVSYVQAFRQMSLPVGILLGFLVLKERITSMKLVAACLILGGLLMVTLC